VRLAGRFVFGTILILLVGVAMLVWAARASLRRDLERELQVALVDEAGMIQSALPEDPGAWPRLVGRWAARRGHAVTLLDAAGQPVADNRLAPGVIGTLGPMDDLPEVRAARAGRVGIDRRAEDGEPLRVYVAIPGTPIVRIVSDLSLVESASQDSQRSVLLAALLVMVLGSVLALIAARTMTRPLAQLAAAARAMPGGQAPRFQRSGIPEIDQLSQALRQAHQELEARFETLRQERAESATLVDAMVEGVLASDARGRILTANPAARRLLGYAPGQPLPDLPELFRAKAAREVVDATLGGQAILDRELDLDGRTLLVNSRPLPSGGTVLVLHDMTEVRRLEAVRRDFVANVSHELKTPLTSISGYAETLLSEDLDAETRQTFLRTVINNARRMQRLVDDQLDLSRIESGRWQARPEWLDVEVVAREAWLARADAATAAGISFAVRPGPGAERVRVDSDGIGQILGNLFDNAIRYTPRGGTITCRSDAESGGMVLAVSDTGSGIAKEHLPRLFERFYRVDPARSRDQGGTGLGLAIVKHLVEAHGGRVSAESELGRGTTIRCWFPAA